MSFSETWGVEKRNGDWGRYLSLIWGPRTLPSVSSAKASVRRGHSVDTASLQAPNVHQA